MLQYIIWNPDINLFSLGSFSVRWYSLCWGIGILLAYIIVNKLYNQQHIPQEKFDPLVLYCFLGILVGARLGHCLFYEPGYFLRHPVEMFLPIRQTVEGWQCTGYLGLASHGGTLGLMIALWLYVRRTKLNLMRVLDNIAIATPFTACCIRLGNLMNSEIVGMPTSQPWGFIFVANQENFARHPAQLYEAIAYFVFGLIGFWLYRRLRHKVGTGYFFGYCLTTIFVFRFLVEFLKEVQEPWELSLRAATGLDEGQLLSIPFIILGLYCWADGKFCKKLGEKPVKP